MLPPACRWIDSPDASCLHWHYACVAVVRADGRVLIQWGRAPAIERRAASLEQGKRHVERWISKRPGLPPGKRAMATRERMRGGARVFDDAAWARLTSPRIPHAPSCEAL